MTKRKVKGSQTRKFDAADFLTTDEDREAYLATYEEDGTEAERKAARDTVERSRR